MNKLLFTDVLTTGLKADKCAIYNIGGILCTEGAGVLNEKERFNLMACPHDEARITEQALWTGNITRGTLSLFPPQEDAFKTFLDIIRKHVDERNPNDKLYLAGFNTGLATPFIMNWFSRNGETFRNFFYQQSIDLMSISAFSLIEERRNMPDFHMTTAARFLNVILKKERSYDCLSYAENCIEIYKSLRARLRTGQITQHVVSDNITTNFNR